MTEFSNIEEYMEETDLEYKEKKGWKEKFWDFIGNKYFVPIIIVLVAVIAFSLGRISGLEEKREPVKIISSDGEVKGASTNNLPQLENSENVSVASGVVVASKNGTKYHYPWCAGAKQISEKNKITFNSIEEARVAGYTPASNCKGLK